MSAKKSTFAAQGKDLDGIIDYTGDVETEPIRFRIAPDVFEAVPEAPGGMFLDLANVVGAETDADKVSAVEEFFSQVLYPESAELFSDRLRDPQSPITLKQALRAFEGLISKYAGDTDRPTQAQGSSRSGSRKTGQSSTARARSAASAREEQLSDVS